MDASDLKRAPAVALDAVKRASAAIGRSPGLALLASLAAGFVVGLISRRSPREREPK
jgi:hypothetical protein